jgi:hypothetical protein
MEKWDLLKLFLDGGREEMKENDGGDEFNDIFDIL